MPSEQSKEILDALKLSAAALRDAQVEFALAGDLAAWARGGPATEQHIDFLIRQEDASPALAALRAAGMRTECPPEGWLVKAWRGEVLIELIYAPRGILVDTGFFARCERLNVAAVEMLVASLDDLLVGKLLVLNEHDLDFGAALEWSRSLREQISWAEVGFRTNDSPFARTFFHLLVELQVLDGLSELVVR